MLASLKSVSSEAQGNYVATVFGSVSGPRWHQQQATTMTYVCCMLCLKLACLCAYNYTDINRSVRSKMWRLQQQRIMTHFCNINSLSSADTTFSMLYYAHLVPSTLLHCTEQLLWTVKATLSAPSTCSTWVLQWCKTSLQGYPAFMNSTWSKVIKQALFPVATRYTKQTARSRGVYETISTSRLSINSH